MERAPQAPEMTPEQIHARIAQIDQEIIAAEGKIRLVPGESQESTQGDDDAVEGEFNEQEFGQLGLDIQDLRREKALLQEKLTKKS